MKKKEYQTPSLELLLLGSNLNILQTASLPHDAEFGNPTEVTDEWGS